MWGCVLGCWLTCVLVLKLAGPSELGGLWRLDRSHSVMGAGLSDTLDVSVRLWLSRRVTS